MKRSLRQLRYLWAIFSLQKKDASTRTQKNLLRRFNENDLDILSDEYDDIRDKVRRGKSDSVYRKALPYFGAGDLTSRQGNIPAYWAVNEKLRGTSTFGSEKRRVFEDPEIQRQIEEVITAPRDSAGPLPKDVTLFRGSIRLPSLDRGSGIYLHDDGPYLYGSLHEQPRHGSVSDSG